MCGPFILAEKFSLQEVRTPNRGSCVSGEVETCPAGGLPGTLSIVQSVNGEVLVGMSLYIVCIGVHEGNGVAIAEVDNDIATDLRDTVGKIVCGRDIKTIDTLLNLQNVFAGIEVENDVVSAATIEQECIAAISADENVVSSTAIKDVVAIPTVENVIMRAAIEQVGAVAALENVISIAAIQHVAAIAAAQDVISFIAEENVVSVFAEQGVVTRAAERMSFPLPPKTVSLPSPPNTRSSPPWARMKSSKREPNNTSS
jgi:hypothetical protein